MSWEIKTGHVLDVLAGLEPESVQTCVTSPPYWGLRDYGDGGQGWPAVTYAPMPGLPPLDIPAQTVALGLEPDPWAYVGHLVEVFRAVRRVMRDDGTLWLNLGDSYAGGGTIGRNDTGPEALARRAAKYGTGTGSGSAVGAQGTRPQCPGLKAKDLCGIPWRVAYALQADGWYLRSDIIWHKPNPMPESCTDRPTKAHEYLFLLSKGPRYFYDHEAIKEPEADGDRGSGNKERRYAADVGGAGSQSLGRGIPCQPDGTGRNARSVWTITTRPYSAAHFATFPPELPERCIKAGTSERGACSTCGAPLARELERVSTGQRYSVGKSKAKNEAGLVTGFSGYDDGSSSPVFKTIGWRPGCACGTGRVPCIVLDPFSGAGTTGMVARRLQRAYIGAEQSEEYAEMSRRRIDGDAPLFNRGTP